MDLGFCLAVGSTIALCTALIIALSIALCLAQASRGIAPSSFLNGREDILHILTPALTQLWACQAKQVA